MSGSAMRNRRLELALSQEEVAERAGLARSTVLKAEAGRRLRPSTIRKLARALRCRPSDLVVPRGKIDD